MRAIYIFFMIITVLQIKQVQANEIKAVNEKKQHTVLQTYNELEAAIDEIVQKTKTQGLAVAIVGTKPWQYTTGHADVSTKRAVTASTQFRIGSISKVFVALSILTLVEQGDLTLNMPLKQVLPEFEFENPWEETNPVRVHHLLEHTTGWDAPDFKVLAHNSVDPVARKQALALSISGRASRWPPGSRTAYNNQAYEVAAFIVEKLSGKSFERFVDDTFFTPLGMANASYFFTEHYKKHAATLYRGLQAQPYANLSFRAAGAINADLNDMKVLVQHLLEQSKSSMLAAKMEKPFNSLALKQGVEVGFGLGLNRFKGNEYKYYGIEGALRGANSLVVYQKQLNVGHVIMSNSESPAIRLINQLLIDFETQHLAQERVEKGQVEKKQQGNQRAFNQDEMALTGFYRPINATNTRFAFLTQLLPWRLIITEDNAMIKSLVGGKPRQLFNTLAAGIRQSGTGDIVLASGIDPIEGKVIYYGPQTLAPISALSAYLLLITLLLFAVLSIITLLICLPWLLYKAVKGKIKQSSIPFIALPSVSLVFFALTLFMVKVINHQVNVFEVISTVNAYTFLFIAFGLMFILGCLYNLVYLFQNRNLKISKVAFVYSISFSVVQFMVMSYLVINASIVFI